MCDENVVLYGLDRLTFTNIVKEASIRRRERFEDFLSKIDIFSELEAYEKSKLCDVLQSETFQKGQIVIQQGEKGDRFYLIEEGEAEARKKNKGSF